MAQSGQSVDSLYISLGLNLSDLETDLIAAERTVTDNIRRLSRQSEIIRLRTEVEIAGLDETADAERILQTRMDSLNQRMEIQRDRVRLITAELQSLTNAHGEESAIVQRATIRLERERLALSNLEGELQRLNDTQAESNELQDESNGLFGELGDLLPEMPTKLQALGMAFGAVTAGIGAATAATQDLLEEFRELQNQSYELNMSVNDTETFLRELKLAGGDIGDLEGFIRGISDAYIKGEYDDPEFIALRKYGEEIVDETGRLKNFKDMTEAVYRAWEQANAAGEGIEFLQMAGGETGIRDAIQYFTRLKEAREDAAKIYDAGLDAEQLHKLDRVFNLLEEQSKELHSAIGNIFAPAAQEAAEIFFDVIHDGTEFLAENKDEIQRWGFVAAETFSTIAEKLSEITSYQTPDTGDKNVDQWLDALQWQASEFNEQALWGDQSQWSNIFSKLPHDLLESLGILDRAAQRQQEYAAEVDATSDAVDGLADSLAEETAELEKNDDVLSQYAQQRINEFKDELEDIQIELDFGDNDYEKALAELDLWRERELTDKLRVSSEERAAIEELYAAKSAQIEQDRADKIEEIRKSVDAEFMSEIDQRIAKIEEEKEAWIKAGMDEAEATELAQRRIAKAFEDAVDRIKGTVQTLEDKIFEIDHSQYENDLRKIRQEYLRTAEELQRQGIFTPELKGQLDYLYNRQKQKLDARADESRRAGGDYTKAPEGAMQRGGNNIVVIGADQIIDDGLKRANIGVMVDERNIRAQLLPKISQEARDVEAAAQATRDLTDVQKEFVQQASGFQLIAGDTVANNFQQIEGDQFISAPTAELQQLGDALQQTAADIEQADPAQKIAQAESALTQTLNQAAQDFPPDYFKNLADGVKAVSDTQLALTRSTLDLIDAQSKWKDALKNMPQDSAQGELSTDGFQRLSTSTLDLRKTQDLIARQTRELTLLPTPKKQDSGFELGFDHDLFGTLTTASTTLIGLLRAAGAIAPHPAVKLGAIALGGALGAATGKGTAEANAEQPDERLTPYITTDLSSLAAPLSAIDQKLDSLMQSLQRDTADNSFAGFGDALAEKLGALPNIESYTRDIVTAVQSIDFPTEVIVTPLSNISGVIQQILTQLQNRQLPPITIAPNIDIDLGGAYVFDDTLKKALVDDITTDVVVHVKDAVQQATSKSSYGYSA